MRRYLPDAHTALWLLACIMLAAPDLLLAATRGPDAEALASPMGRLAQLIAAAWTPAPSPLVAGSARRSMQALLMFAGSLLALLAFCAGTWRAMRRPAPRRAGALVATLGAIAIGCDTNLGYVVAAQIGFLFPFRRALLWTSVQALLSGAVQLVLVAAPLSRSDHRFGIAALLVGAQCALQVGVTALVCAAVREREGRLALALANAELLATQAMLAETVRGSERRRIARDMHDVLGHHLTALKLHLDLALRQPGAHASAPLRTAGDVAASLLAEIRLLVSRERADVPIDLCGALGLLCARIPVPRIALDMDPAVAIESPAAAHAVFCCIQEAVSNAVRHAGAATMTIRLACDAAGDIVVDIADDGRGSAGAPHGNGLRGIAERVAQFGGELLTGDRLPAGFALRLRLPATGAAL
jgi:two-component system sensor histidine kinase DesK